LKSWNSEICEVCTTTVKEENNSILKW